MRRLKTGVVRRGLTSKIDRGADANPVGSNSHPFPESASNARWHDRSDERICKRWLPERTDNGVEDTSDPQVVVPIEPQAGEVADRTARDHFTTVYFRMVVDSEGAHVGRPVVKAYPTAVGDAQRHV